MKRILMSIFIFIIIFTLPFVHLINNKIIWESFSANIDKKDAIIDNTFNFIQLREGLSFFDEKVISHMYDVREIYWNTIIILVTTIILIGILSFYMKKEEIKDSVLMAARINGLFWIFISSWILVSFQSFFNLFHKLLFEGNYQFSYDNLIIQLFPKEFFFNMGLILIISELTLSFLLIIYLRKKIISHKFLNKILRLYHLKRNNKSNQRQ